MTRSHALPIALLLAAAPLASARADECPNGAPDKERRPLAREWFSRGEAAQKDGRDTDALRAYECSFSLYPHAFTAFNMAKAAEKVGDLELAIERYGTYLELRPDASDRGEVERTVAELRARLAKVRESAAPADPAVPSGPAPAAEPLAPMVSHPAPPPPRGGGQGRAVLPWIATGGGLALVASGVALNLAARSRVDDCHERFDKGDPGYAQSCEDARPFAYGSYAAIALGAAAAVGGVAWLLWPAPRAGARVGWAPLPGGGFAVVTRDF